MPTRTDVKGVCAAPANQPECKEINGEGFGWRHVQRCLMAFFVIASYLHRSSVSVGLVAMTTQTTPDQEVFHWSHEQQGTVISSFLWGYAVTQIPAGYITTRFGAKRLAILSMSLSSILMFCIPIVSRQWDLIGLTVLRICLGLVQGVTYPGTNALLGKWAVPEERSTAAAFTLAAQHFGVFVSMALAGIIAVNWGWESIYYVYGGIALTIAALWIFFAADTPEEHPYISDAERDYICKALPEASGKPHGPTPWRGILTNRPLFVIVVNNVAFTWCLWFALAAFPSYANDIFELSLPLNGVVSGVPFLLSSLLGPVLGLLSDKIIREGWASTLVTRKIMNGIGLWIPAFLFIAVNLTPNNMTFLKIVELAAAVAFSGGCFSGYSINLVELSPRFSGLTSGLCNFVASITSSFPPPLTGALVDKLGQNAGWAAGFYIAAAVGFFAELIYFTFASTNEQPWNNVEEVQTECKKIQTCEQRGKL